MEPRVTCVECGLFLDAVKGIRGPYAEGRVLADRRQSYRTGAARGGAVTVSGEFFDLLRDETCAEWLDHLAELRERGIDLREHTRELPAWIAGLPESLDWPAGRDAAAHVAAGVLGISVRSVYRGVEPR